MAAPKRIVTLLLLAALGIAITSTIQAQPSPPSQVVFTALRPPPDYGARLIRYDVARAEFTTFYAENGDLRSYLRPIRWSPDGSTLAVYRQSGLTAHGTGTLDLREEICLLDRDGRLLRCLHAPPLVFDPYEGTEQLDTLSWSADSSRLYYASEDSEATRLVEADAATGATLRVLFETRYYDDRGDLIPVSLSWSPDLRYVATNLGHWERTYLRFPQWRIDLQSGVSLDLRTALFTSTAVGELNTLCLHFSPHGTYLSGLGKRNGDVLVLLDAEANTVHRIDSESGLGALIITSCPYWEPSEASLFFLGSSQRVPTAWVFQYTLADRTLRVIHQLPELVGRVFADGKWQIDDLAIAPGGRLIAGIEAYSLEGSAANSLAIINQLREYATLAYTPYVLSHPVWVPASSPHG